MLSINKILLVGFGSIGKRHLGNLQTLVPDAEIAILRSSSAISSETGHKNIFTIEQALSFNPDIALLCNPASLHIPIAAELAAKGVHLFIEKPLSDRLEGLDNFANIARHADINVMVGYNLRFNQSMQFFKQLLDQEEYGRILCVSAEVGQHLPDWRPAADYRKSVSANAALGGGALLELSHELDYLCWLFGEAICVTGQLLKVSDLDIDVEDLVLANVCLEKAKQKIFCNIQLDFLQRKPTRSCKVICEEATLVWDAIEDRVKINQKNSSDILFQGDKNVNRTYEKELQLFIESVQGKHPSPIPLVDGIKVMRLVEAIKQSSTAGKRIYL